MKKEDFDKLKEALKKLHPARRLFYLNKLLKKEKDKENISELNKEIEEAKKELRELRSWKEVGSLTTRTRFRLEERQLPAGKALEDVVVETPVEVKKDESVKYELQNVSYSNYEVSGQYIQGNFVRAAASFNEGVSLNKGTAVEYKTGEKVEKPEKVAEEQKGSEFTSERRQRLLSLSFKESKREYK